jgi:hypothetical protein
VSAGAMVFVRLAENDETRHGIDRLMLVTLDF